MFTFRSTETNLPFETIVQFYKQLHGVGVGGLATEEEGMSQIQTKHFSDSINEVGKYAE